MSEREKPPGLRTFLEKTLGLDLDPELIGRLEKGFGTKIDDNPARWDDVKKKLAADAGEDPAVPGIVEPVYERLLGEATGGRGDGPIELQPTWTPGERAVLLTRFIAEEFDSGGPLALLTSDVRALLDEAIAGFRLLGLDEHADALAELMASGLDAASGDDDVEEFAEDWLNIEDGDPARAEYIRSHPEEFRR